MAKRKDNTGRSDAMRSVVFIRAHANGNGNGDMPAAGRADYGEWMLTERLIAADAATKGCRVVACRDDSRASGLNARIGG